MIIFQVAEEAELRAAPAAMLRSSVLRSSRFAQRTLKASAIVSLLQPRSARSVHGAVSLADAKLMPIKYNQMTNETICNMASDSDGEAIKERLIRHVMTTDEVEWQAASESVEEIGDGSPSGALVFLPQKLGLMTAVTIGLASFPMCFHLDTALYFNEHFVTTDIPESEDLETWLEVGSWTWNWMEPPLGQASFFLLTLQFARAQMDNIGSKSFTERKKHSSAEKIADAFPDYERRLVVAYARSLMN